MPRAAPSADLIALQQIIKTRGASAPVGDARAEQAKAVADPAPALASASAAAPVSAPPTERSDEPVAEESETQGDAEPERPSPEEAPPTGALGAAGGEAGLQVAPLPASDPKGILDQLTDVAPTTAISAYAQAETASAKALHHQRDALQAKLPRIPAPAGLLHRQQKRTEARSADPDRAHPGRLPAVTARAPAERPTMDLSGEANPAKLTELRARSAQEVAGARTEAVQGLLRDYGENDIHPRSTKDTLQAEKALSVHTPARSPGGKQPALPAEVAGGLDSSLAVALRARISEQRDKYTSAEDQLDRDVDGSRRKADADIGHLTTAARDAQREEQKKAKAQVERCRQQGREEIYKVDQEHREEALKATREGNRQIAQKKDEAEQKANQHLADAERKTAEKKREAEGEVEKKKAEASKGSGGFIEWVKRTASTVVEGLNRAVNFVYDNLRKAVKQVFEAAKALVRGVIEVARRAIVGIVRGVGELLKAFVRVAFAAFPKIVERITRAIDVVVGAAVAAVNTIAEGLKKAIGAVLDFLASTIDKLLGLAQSLYNAAFTLIGKLIRGELKKILEGIGNLVQAARQMPDHFWGQAQEELIGMNLSEPLPFERAAPPTPAVAARAAEAAGHSPADVELLGRDRLHDDDVQMDEVAELDLPPDFIAGLQLKEGEEITFGEYTGPAWTAASLRADALGVEPAARGAMQGRGEGEPREAMLKTPEEELEELLAQRPEGGCTKEKTGEPASAGAVPEHLKKGPFTPTQRGRYLLHQMREGISHWFSCNWPWLLAAAVAGLVGFIALNILTGGAVLAALPLLMQILGAVMIGVAIVQVTRHVGDYMKRGFAGDVDGAAKSLARGLAVGAIELIFALLFNIGAIVKALRGGLKGAARTAGAAAKATVTTTLRNVREAGRLGVEAGRAALRNGRLVLSGGLKRGFARGARSLGELAQRLWARVRFRRFKLRLAGRRIQLWGYINPWVLVASGKIEQVTVSGGRPEIGDLVEVAGRSEAGVIVGVVDTMPSAVIQDLKAMSAPGRRALYQKLAGSSKEEIRAAILAASATGRNAKELRDALTAAGKVAKKGEHAHHMIPSTHRLAEEARLILKSAGIGVNDARNGVFLSEALHKGLHTKAYIGKITLLLKGAKPSDVPRVLASIEAALQKGGLAEIMKL